MPPSATAAEDTSMMIPIHVEMNKLVSEVVDKAVDLLLFNENGAFVHTKYTVRRADYIDQLRKLMMPISGRRVPRHDSARAFGNFFAALEVLCHRSGSDAREEILAKANPRVVLGNDYFWHQSLESRSSLHFMFEDLLSELRNMETLGYQLSESQWTFQDAVRLQEGMSDELAAILANVQAYHALCEQHRHPAPVDSNDTPFSSNEGVGDSQTLLDTLYDQLEAEGLVFASTVVRVGDEYGYDLASKDDPICPGRSQIAEDIDVRKYDWIFDSGCQTHVCRDRELFNTYTVFNPPEMMYGAGSGPSLGYGDITLVVWHNSAPRQIVLKDVRHCPSMTVNAIAVPKLARALNCGFTAIPDYCELIDRVTGEVIATGHEHALLWWLDVSTARSSLMHGNGDGL